MSVKVKSRRRLVILISVVSSVLAVGATVYFVRMWQLDRRAAQALATGREALADRRYNEALQNIGTYVQRNETDVKALYEYAVAREHVELPNGKHIASAASFYNRILSFPSETVEAVAPGLQDRSRHALLNMYVRGRYGAESLATIKELLARGKHDDLPALRAQPQVLYGRHDYFKATEAANEYLKRVPLDVEIRSLLMEMQVKDGKVEVVRRDAKALLEQNNSDPRAELIQAIALGLAADASQGVAERTAVAAESESWLKKAAAHPPRDPRVVRPMVALLDNRGLHDLSFEVLRGTAGADAAGAAAAPVPGSDPVAEAAAEGEMAVRREYVSRLWQAGRTGDVLAFTRGLNPARVASDAELLGLRALASGAVGQDQDVRDIIGGLGARIGDRNAAAWAKALPFLTPRATLGETEALRVFETEVLELAPNNPYFRSRLGDAFARLGEDEAAATQWHLASRSEPNRPALAPAWSAPLVKASKLLLSRLERPREANFDAQLAAARSPKDLETAVNVVLTVDPLVWSKADVASTNIGAKLDAVRELNPSEERTLPAEVHLRALTEGTAAASAQLGELLRRGKPLEASTLAALAAVSHRMNLGLEDACFALCFEKHGVTPDTALARATLYRTAGKGEEALKFLEGAMKSGAGGTPLAWRMAWGRYLDSARDPRGAEVWSALSREFPGDVTVQWAALSTSAAVADRNLAKWTIDHLATAIGRETPGIRLAKAIWLMGAGTKKDTEDATKSLEALVKEYPAYVRARMALASCFESLGRDSDAVQHLSVANNLRGGDPNILLELARLARKNGNAGKMPEYLMQLSSPEVAAALTPVQRRMLAAFMVEGGEGEAALRAALAGSPSGAAEARADAMFDARLYRRLNMPDKAAETYQKLLEHPDAEVVNAAMDFYLSVGRESDARAALARLDGAAGPQPGDAEALWGMFYQRTNDAPHALESYTKATKLGPANPRGWRSLVVFHLFSGQPKEAIEAAKGAVSAGGAGRDLRTIAENAELFGKYAADPRIRPLVEGVLNPALGDKALGGIVEAVKVLAKAPPAPQPPGAEVLNELRKIAGANPESSALQVCFGRALVAAGASREALEVAKRTADAFPMEPGTTQLLVASLLSDKRFVEAESTARKWRAAAGGPEAKLADLAIAIACIGTARTDAPAADRAAEVLRPYLPEAHAHPELEENLGVLRAYANARLFAGAAGEVLPLLQPHLSLPEYRSLLRNFAITTKSLPSQLGAGWMEALSPVTPPDALIEAAEAAVAWVAIAKQDPGRAADADRAVKRATDMAVAANSPAAWQQVLLMAYAFESLLDDGRAEAVYRTMLKADPANIRAANNLAMVLARGKTHLDEAVSLVDKVIASIGSNAKVDGNTRASIYDTMAAVMVARKEYANAVKYMQQAVQSDPANPQWQITLADDMVQGGLTKESGDQLDQLEKSAAGTQLSEDQKTQVGEIRRKIAARGENRGRAGARRG